MKPKPLLLSVIGVLLLLSSPLEGQFKTLRSRDWMNKGVKAFKAQDYPTAETDFKKALELDPDFTNALEYLGTTYAYEVIPENKSPENIKTADLAIATFQQILDSDSKDLIALKQISSIYRVTGRLKQAREFQIRVTELTPQDPEAHYTLGVIDWALAYENAADLLARDGLKDDGLGDTGMSAQTCSSLMEQNSPLVEEGIQEFTHAIDLKADYVDAMIYINLVYRRKADLHCGHPGDEKKDIETAVDWQQCALKAGWKPPSEQPLTPQP